MFIKSLIITCFYLQLLLVHQGEFHVGTCGRKSGWACSPVLAVATYTVVIAMEDESLGAMSYVNNDHHSPQHHNAYEVIALFNVKPVLPQFEF